MITEPIKWGPAARARDEGIQQAADHAGPDWKVMASLALYNYALTHSRFLIEDVRVYADKHGVEAPPDARAWGAVTQGAIRAGFIERDGYAPARSSHLSPKPVWKSLIASKALMERQQ